MTKKKETKKMATDCYECARKQGPEDQDKQMRVALDLALGDCRDTIKAVWSQMFVMGLVAKKDPPDLYNC
jgi:hypothetical protein